MLEDKRNAMMNSISGGITNLLENVTTWQNGYFNASGGIDVGTRGEIYEEDYIEVDTTKKYYLYVFGFAGNRTTRFFIAEYNSNNEIQTLQNSGEVACQPNFTIKKYTFTHPKIRVSFRSFKTNGEHPKITLFESSEIQDTVDVMQDSGIGV